VTHRVNTVEKLKETPSQYGIEFDVREGIYEPVVTHDPWTPSIPLSHFLRECHHAFYIVNIKCEGIEPRVLEFLERFRITNFFLLDCSFPMIVRLSRHGESRLALRVSEYEDIQTAIRMKGRVDWIWVDCFTKIPITPEDAELLHSMGFKLCLVSPELQGRGTDEISEYKQAIGSHMDAICTKVPHLWETR